MCTSVANDPKRNVFKARKMFYKVVQYTYIKDVPFTLHHLTKTKAKELLLLAHWAGVESDLKKKSTCVFDSHAAALLLSIAL